MDIILNYIFVGFAFTFLIDLLLCMESVRKHEAVQGQDWGMTQRMLCILIWPLALLVFLINFINQFFK